MYRKRSPGFSRSARAACGVFSVSAAMLGASLWTNDVLSAVQDEPAQEVVPAPATTPGLKVPTDLSEESLEKIDSYCHYKFEANF